MAYLPLNVIGVWLCLCLAFSQPNYAQNCNNDPQVAIPSPNLIPADTVGMIPSAEPVVVPPHLVLAQGVIRFYRTFASPARGTVCPMYPTCSQYAYEAFNRHNPLQAWLMVSDRLMRCGADPQQYPQVLAGECYRWFDGDPKALKDGSGSVFRRDSRLKVSGGGTYPDMAADRAVLPERANFCESDSSMYRFAEWLKNRGDYGPAVIEFLRLEYYHPQSEFLLDARKSVCECYYLSGSYPEAIECVEGLLPTAMPCQAEGDLILIMGASYFRGSYYEKAIETFGRIPGKECFAQSEQCAKAMILQGLSAAYARKWKVAEKCFLEVSDSSQYVQQARSCAHLCSEIGSSRRRNPGLSGVLAIIPGLGYLYDGYPRTAISAFIINGVFIWGTVEAFQKDQEGLGATLGVIGLGWYAGNIYGSVTSARRSNEKQERDMLLKLDIGFRF
jgi:putative component of membrane protein insertase Oxa1/YidC/SpoIIIJ protein YidD